MVERNPVIGAGRTSLATANQPLNGQYVTGINVAFLLLKQELLDFRIHLADSLVLIPVKQLVETIDEVHETHHFLIANGNIPRSLVPDDTYHPHWAFRRANR